MQRRSFIKFTLATTLALTYQGCGTEKLKGNKAFYYPRLMMECADEGQLMAIGKAYFEKVVEERTEENLLAALYRDDINRNLASLTDTDLISGLLTARIKKDFENNRTIVLDGWVLSITEARQCALFSLRP